MSNSLSAAQATPFPPPVDSSGDAEQLIVHLIDVMDALLGTVEEETSLVRAGRVSAATRLEPAKADLARLYVADIARLKTSYPYLSHTIPDVLEQLHRRHDTFRALLQINLTVLATAHAVAEGLIRGVSGELARKDAPQTYGPSGRQAGSAKARPLAMSRML
jgi:hypothetical protein